jgi:hypothetical protein
VQEGRIKNIKGVISSNNTSYGAISGVLEGSVGGNVSGAFDKILKGGGATVGGSNITYDITFDSSRAVPTGPDNAPGNIAVRFWRRVPDPA